MAELAVWEIEWFKSSLFIGQRTASVTHKKCDLVLSENYMHYSQIQFILSQESHAISNNNSGELESPTVGAQLCIYSSVFFHCTAVYYRTILSYRPHFTFWSHTTDDILQKDSEITVFQNTEANLAFQNISFFLVLLKIQLQLTTERTGSSFAEILLGLHWNLGEGSTQSSEFLPKE